VRPRIYGKFDERDNAGGEWSQPRGQWLLPARYELSPAVSALDIWHGFAGHLALPDRLDPAPNWR
jgi:hypothetical protein